MKTYDWYRYTFEDGYQTIVRGLSRQELALEQLKHGKLVKKEYVGNA